MDSLVCNTPEGARLLRRCQSEVGADVQEASIRSRHSACPPCRGSSPHPGIEAFILQHALQVSGALPLAALEGLFEWLSITNIYGWIDGQ